MVRWRSLAIAAILFLAGLSSFLPLDAQTFKPGDRGIPSEAWSNWHGFAPGNKSKQMNINFTSSTDSTVTFGFTMDYFWGFTSTADCSIRAKIDISGSTPIATGSSIDTTRYIYVPAGSPFEFSEMWNGFKLKGKGSGKLNGRAVGRTF